MIVIPSLGGLGITVFLATLGYIVSFFGCGGWNSAFIIEGSCGFTWPLADLIQVDVKIRSPLQLVNMSLARA